MKKSLDGIKESIEDSVSPREWLNDYYDILNLEGKFINEIILDKYAVIPNQKGELKKRKDLFVDNKIDEQLKNVLDILNYDIRSELRHLEIVTKSKYKEEIEGQIVYAQKDLETVIKQIDKFLKDAENENTILACNYLISCFHTDVNEHRENIYEFSKKVFPAEIEERKFITSNEEAIWNTVDNLQIRRIASFISKQKTLVQLQQSLLFDDKKKTVEWLDSFTTFLDKNGFENIISLKSICILPDQNGVFKQKDILFIDSIEKEAEDLKDIAALLGYNIREELLEKDIFPVLPEIQKRTIEHLAVEIDKRITSRFNERPRTDITRKVFSSLLVWFKKEPSLAKDNFKDLSKNKHLLYDDDEIADNIAKANLLDNIMEETGLSVKQITDRFKDLLNRPNVEELNKLSDKLVSKNITYEQLLQLIENIDLDIGETNITFSTKNDLEQAGKNEENETARKLVFERLVKEGFDFREGIGNHSVVDGVWKNEVEHPLVIKSYRNSSYKFNIRPNEWLQLSKPNAMFWLHRGNGVLEVLNLEGLLRANSEFHVRFDTSTFDFEGLVKFAEVFRFVKNVHFQLDAPNFSMANAFEEYEFNKRKMDLKEVGGDNQNQMH